MIQINPDAVAERFMEYTKIDTQSDPNGTTTPTTEKQKDLGRLLVSQLQEMGITQVELDEFGYVYATVPSNSDKKDAPAVFFCAHIDTAPDASGTNVKPIYHKNYDGGDIVLPDDTTQILSPSAYPYLKKHVGHGVITASGTTLLGADDKAGIAIIMEAAAYLIAHPTIKHGDIKLLFSPDEEVGGMKKVDIDKVGATFGYTLDGGKLGVLEDETFSADGAVITINGVSSHPGYAKGTMVSAMRIAGDFINRLPKDEWCPEATEGKQGFVHLDMMGPGLIEQIKLEFIIRDFETKKLADHHERLKTLAENTFADYPGATMTYEKEEQYRNMKDILDLHPEVMAYATEAVQRAGLEVTKHSIRGGTDGSKLSQMNLPCANIFTGMQNFHGKHEWIGSKDMAKSVETVIHLAMVIEEKAPAPR